MYTKYQSYIHYSVSQNSIIIVIPLLDFVFLRGYKKACLVIYPIYFIIDKIYLNQIT